MTTIPRPLRLATLALGLIAVTGCAEDNEKDFAPVPGSAPAGASVDGEAASTPKKTGKTIVNE